MSGHSEPHVPAPLSTLSKHRLFPTSRYGHPLHMDILKRTIAIAAEVPQRRAIVVLENKDGPSGAKAAIDGWAVIHVG